MIKKLSTMLCVMLSVGLIVLWGCTAGAVTLEWDLNTDDTVKYRVYAGSVSGSYSLMEEATTVPFVFNVPDGDWYFVVTAVDEADNESGFSNEVSTNVDTMPPMIPAFLRILP